jgi:hypothetical protein
VQVSASSVADSHTRKDVPNAVESTRAMQYRYSQSSISTSSRLSTDIHYKNFYMPKKVLPHEAEGPELPNAITMQNETTVCSVPKLQYAGLSRRQIGTPLHSMAEFFHLLLD